MYAIYTYPGCYRATQKKKDEDGSSKSITSFDITFEISETSGSSGSMILFNKPYGSSKTKGLSYEQMLSELDAIKYMATLANNIIRYDVVRLKG